MSAPESRGGYLLVLPWDLRIPGGVSQVVKSLYPELVSLGWRVRILCCDWAYAAPAEARDLALPVVRWRIRSPYCRGRIMRGALSYLLTLPAFIVRWRRFAREHNLTVVNFHFPDASAFNWILLRRLGLWKGRVVLSIHGADVRDPPGGTGRLERWLRRRLLESADLVVACSQELANEVRVLAPRTEARVHVAANGVNPESIRAAVDSESPLPSLSCSRYLINVATFEPKKAQDVLIKAFRILAPRHDVDLVLVGRTTPWLDEVRRLIDGSGLGSRIHLLFDVEHTRVLRLLAGATVFCLPSRAEGHPLAILEAAAVGLPVVATPVGGVPATIDDARSGLLVPVGDETALAHALDRLLLDTQLRARLGAALRQRVETEFTWRATAYRYDQLVRKS